MLILLLLGYVSVLVSPYYTSYYIVILQCHNKRVTLIVSAIFTSAWLQMDSETGILCLQVTQYHTPVASVPIGINSWWIRLTSSGPSVGKGVRIWRKTHPHFGCTSFSCKARFESEAKWNEGRLEESATLVTSSATPSPNGASQITLKSLKPLNLKPLNLKPLNP